MLYDLTQPLTQQSAADVQKQEPKALVGHLGTHFDCMGKPFPLAYTQLPCVLFDVTKLDKDTEITLVDIDAHRLPEGGAALFYSGHADRFAYGTSQYLHGHPQLSAALIDALLEAGCRIIGLDFPGMRRSAEHTPADAKCAERGCFAVENLCGLSALPKNEVFTLCTYPMRYEGLSGLPCRVVARTGEDA